MIFWSTWQIQENFYQSPSLLQKNVVIWPSQSQENVCFGSAHKPVEGPTVSLIGTLTVWYIKRLGFGLVGVSKNKSEKIIQLPYLKDIAKL